MGCAQYEAADDKECLDVFMDMSRLEGIVPALESAHAIACAMRSLNLNLVNHSGCGDKDADFAAKAGFVIFRWQPGAGTSTGMSDKNIYL